MRNGGMNVAVRDLQTLFSVGTLGGLSDGELLGRFVARRDGAVFEGIIQRHGPMVWGVCRRVLRDHHDAEDAFQATFLVLARKASSVMPREKLGNWLYGVAYRTAMTARAKRAKRQGREGQVLDMPEPMAVPDDQRHDLAESLDRELSRLPVKYRIPVVLCDLEGRTHREAASQLGWPVGTVSSRLSRARAMLARRLSRSSMTLSGGSLAVLLAQESASASMPTRLIGSTARAASLYAAGGAATAGVVSAGAVALTGEMMKMMLLSKIKVATTLVLVASALAVGGTGLAYRAQADETTGQKDDLQGRIDQKREELQRLIEEQKRKDQSKAGQEQRKRTPSPTEVEPSAHQAPDEDMNQGKPTEIQDQKDDRQEKGPHTDASEARRTARRADSDPQKAPPIERREAKVFLIPAPRPGSQMEILITTPGKHFERIIPEITDQDRLRVKVEERSENGRKEYEIICSTIEVNALAEPSQLATSPGTVSRPVTKPYTIQRPVYQTPGK